MSPLPGILWAEAATCGGICPPRCLDWRDLPRPRLAGWATAPGVTHGVRFEEDDGRQQDHHKLGNPNLWCYADGVNLSEAPVGPALQIGAVGGATATRLRLAELGLRTGETVVVSHRTSGGGRVVSVDHCRIALDRATLGAIEVVEAVTGAAGGPTVAASSAPEHR